MVECEERRFNWDKLRRIERNGEEKIEEIKEK